MCICYPSYIAAINTAGYPQSALVLTVFGQAYKAADACELTLKGQSTRFQDTAERVIVAPVRQNLNLGAEVRAPGARNRSVRAPRPWCGTVVISKRNRRVTVLRYCKVP